MDAAWEQIGKVLEAQRRIRFAQFGVQVSHVWYDHHLVPTLGVRQQKTLLLMAPVDKRVLTTGSVITVHHAYSQSLVQPAMTSAALRRVIRPRGRMTRSLPFDNTRRVDQLIFRTNAGEVSAAPPKVAPPGVVTADEAAEQIFPADVPAAIVDILRRFPQLPWLILLIAILIAGLVFFIFAPVIAAVVAIAVIALGRWVYLQLSRWRDAIQASDSIRESSQTPSWVDALPGAADLVITEPGSSFVPRRGPDNAEVSRFKSALRDTFSLVQISAETGALPVRCTLELTRIADDGVRALSPSRTIPKRILTGIFVPPRIKAEIGEGSGSKDDVFTADRPS